MKWPKLFTRSQPVVGPTGMGDFFWADWHAIRDSISVNPRTAMQNSTVAACVNAISRDIAGAKLKLYKRTENGGREEVLDHPLSKALRIGNSMQNSTGIIEGAVVDMLLTGNGYIRAHRGPDAEVYQIEYLPPTRCKGYVRKDGQLRYIVSAWDGETQTDLGFEDVIHIRTRTDDGRLGISPIVRNSDIIAMALTLDQYGSEYFGNSGKLNGVFNIEGNLKPDQLEQYRKHIAGTPKGSFAVLDQKTSFTQVSTSMGDSQYVELRDSLVEDVCRVFGISPMMAGATKNSSYLNSAEASRQHVAHALKRHLDVITESFELTCLNDYGNTDLFIEFDLSSLLDSDRNAQADYIVKLISAGVITPNEARDLVHLPPHEDGDELAANKALAAEQNTDGNNTEKTTDGKPPQP